MSKFLNTDSPENTGRPRVTISVAITLDGYMDSIAGVPLQISSKRDLLEVHRLRAASDAILVGATTLRQDNCQLTARHGQGGPVQPTRITLTRSGCIDYDARFFAQDGARKMIFCPRGVASILQEKMPEQTDVVVLDGDSCSMLDVLEKLGADGVKELMIEGGASVISQFLRERLVDRVRLATGSQILGAAGKTRLFESATVTDFPDTRWRVKSVENFDDTVVIWYDLADAKAH